MMSNLLSNACEPARTGCAILAVGPFPMLDFALYLGRGHACSARNALASRPILIASSPITLSLPDEYSQSNNGFRALASKQDFRCRSGSQAETRINGGGRVSIFPRNLLSLGSVVAEALQGARLGAIRVGGGGFARK